MSDKKSFVFDEYIISKSRWKTLDKIIEYSRLSFRTALDAGTGIGYFAAHLSRQHKLRVTAFDIRHSNIEEAQRRYPEVQFITGNIENPNIVELGKFDLVVAFGLIYHLENPFRAIRNLVDMTKELLIIESMIIPGRLLSARIIDEAKSEDQGIRHVTIHFTERGLVKLLYLSGVPYVYFPLVRTDHNDFHGGLFRHRKRTILVGATSPLDKDSFRLIPKFSHKEMGDDLHYRTPVMRWLYRRGKWIYSSLISQGKI